MIKLYKCSSFNNFRIHIDVKIYLLIAMPAPNPLLLTGSKELAEGSGLSGCYGVSLH